MVGTKSILGQVNQQRLKWFGHLIRMDPKQPALRAYSSQLSGSKPRGRPRKRWVDGGVKKPLMEEHNISMAEATHRAQDRQPVISPQL